jgi:hypothetical protein
LLFSGAIGPGLAGQNTFKIRYGTTGSDIAEAVEVLSDGSFIVAGLSTGGGLGGNDALLVKFSPTGAVEWSKALGGSGSDSFRNLFACSDGNYIAIGETGSFGAGSFDIFVVKFGTGGNVIWQRTYGGSGFDQGFGVGELSDGYVISGQTQSFGAGFWDMYVEKIDFDGVSQWQKVFGNGGGNGAREVIVGGNDEIWVSGFYFINSGNHDFVLFHLDSDGNILSSNRQGSIRNEGLGYLVSGGAGMTASGQTWNYSVNFTQPTVVSYNNSGVLQWAKYYTMPFGFNFDAHIQNTSDGGFIMTNIPDGGIATGYLTKLNGSGDISWSKAYDLGGSGKIIHAQESPDGGYIAVGYTSVNSNDILVLKTDAEGQIEGCCPAVSNIFGLTATYASNTLAPTINTGVAGQAGAGAEQSPGLTEVDFCSGPLCCLKEAGTMTAANLTLCPDQSATFVHNGDEVMGGNDLLQFILFSNPADTLGSILAVSNTPVFEFDPATMQAGVTYYVAAIAGSNVGGNVNLNDPCLSISNAAQVTWRLLPTVQLSVNNPEVCEGGCRTILAVFTGTPPFELTVSNPYSGSQTVTFGSTTGTFQVCIPPGAPEGPFTLQAVSLSDQFCTCGP